MASTHRICNAFLLLLTLNASLSIADKDCPPESQENLRKLGVANNEMALKLLKRLLAVDLTKNPNIFFSPLSISLAFGMLFYGARGNTAEELRTVLGYEKAGLRTDLVHCTFHSLLTENLPASDMDIPDYTLNLANAILVDKNLELITDYKTEVQNLYLASVRDVDFVHNSANIVNDINAWVKDRTNGKIDRLLDRFYLGPSTVMVLLNAVYFKGTWKTQFDPKETRSQAFYDYGLESGAGLVSMMHIEAHFPYTRENDLKALELPYKGENLCMIVLLPNQLDGLKNLVNNLTPERISTIRKNLYKQTVIVSLPKFKNSYSREMTSDFEAVGANSIFRRRLADFTGMTRQEEVFVDPIIHKAVVEVTEEGSEAAAATAITTVKSLAITPHPITPKFTADHPFMFIIIDKRSDMILFAGSVTILEDRFSK